MAKKTTGAATRSTKTRSTAGPNTRPPSPRNEPPAVTAYRALLSAPEDGPLLAGEEFRERIEAATGRGAVDVLADVFARYLAPPPVPEWTEEAAPEVEVPPLTLRPPPRLVLRLSGSLKRRSARRLPQRRCRRRRHKKRKRRSRSSEN